MKCSILLNKAFWLSLSFMKWIPGWPTLNSVTTSQLHRTYKSISSFLWHLLQVGLFISPSFNRCPFKRQCPTSTPVSCLNWFLLHPNGPTLLLVEDSQGSPLHFFCPGMDFQYSWWPLFIQSLTACLATLRYHKLVQILFINIQI
jgi:hypothetical protein